MQELKSFLGFLLNMIAFSIFVVLILAIGTIIAALCLAWIAIPVIVIVLHLNPYWLLADIPVLTICYLMYFSAKVETSVAINENYNDNENDNYNDN